MKMRRGFGWANQAQASNVAISTSTAPGMMSSSITERSK